MLATDPVSAFGGVIAANRPVDADNIAIPALLATSAVHHHLIRQGLRTESGGRAVGGGFRFCTELRTLLRRGRRRGGR